ncbi:MAG: hypothetical protein ACRDNZ_16575, partial [Streptosporangiaceae bacterium]
VRFPARSAARAAEVGLSRVGYDVARDDSDGRGRQLLVHGWSPEGLETRLNAMRTVIETLTAEPGGTAESALDHLDSVLRVARPPRPGPVDCLRQAERELREWITATSGIHAPCNPLTRPADTGTALRLSAAWHGEEAIDDLVRRHVQVAELATALYPDLLRGMSHDRARDSAVRRASLAFHIRRTLAKDTTLLMPNGPVTPAPASGGRTGPDEQNGRRSPAWRDNGTAQIFPRGGASVGPVGRPPAAAPDGLRGRNFPSGSAGQHC